MKKTDDEIRQAISETLIKCRIEKGLTQLELAEQIESKPTTVASWEQGKSLPTPQMLYRLAKYYQKTMEYMYGEEE